MVVTYILSLIYLNYLSDMGCFMKISCTNSAVVLVGSKTEILKTLQVISQQYKTVQEWLDNSDGRSLYIVK